MGLVIFRVIIQFNMTGTYNSVCCDELVQKQDIEYGPIQAQYTHENKRLRVWGLGFEIFLRLGFET